MGWEGHLTKEQREQLPELYEIEKSCETVLQLRNGRHTVTARVHALRRIDAPPDERYVARYEVLVNGRWHAAFMPPRHRPTADAMLAQALADLVTEYPAVQ